MNPSVETIASEALLLPSDQRFTLAHRILVSMEPAVDPGLEMAWDAEIKDRIRRYDEGLLAGIPGSEVFAELDQRLKPISSALM
jgi:hypothetical protein